MPRKFNRLLALAAALFTGYGLQADQPVAQVTADPTAKAADQSVIVERAIRRRQLAAARAQAAENARPAREALQAAQAAKANVKANVKGALAPAAFVTLAPGVVAPPGVMNPLGTPDYMSGLVPNYANSPQLRKFVDTLPGLGSGQPNNLGNFIPLASPDRTYFPATTGYPAPGTFPASDFYNIDLVDYTQQLHSDLPPTHLRGYQLHQTSITNGAAAKNYLGPVIIAQRDRPVRIQFNNRLGTGTAGNLLIPVDTTMMGAGTSPGGTTYSQNRAELHLHGGLNPWISDGTPHQWLTPAGEPNANKKGVSFRNVPDMGSKIPGGYPGTAGDGVGTYFYTNAQSGRLMFYHDHAFGITRLNVYAGEAAGYLIVDPTETSLINSGIIPSQGTALPISNDPWDATSGVHSLLNGGSVYTYGIPLIIQDKTFVPGPTQLANQDPTWDTTNWGGFGDLWFPHVYMPNQNPADPSGANAMGRWDYAPWFWPITQTSTTPGVTPTGYLPYGHGAVPSATPGGPDYPGTPNPSLVPEAFMDTPVVNGAAYPSLTVQPQAYRFRILNAANDRMWNLSLFKADATGTEVTMVPAAPGNLTFPAYWPTDGRDGGVPDPTTAGPSIIQIGTESGFLPAPVVIPPTPIGYEYNRRNIVVLNINSHSLLLGPAERADIIVDFSAFAGQTLILYNDAPAPVPAFDSRLDYYTGDPDQSAQGGAAPTLPGYGPNTRTIMQIKVAAGTPAAAFNLAALQAAFNGTATTPGAFAATQHTPVVPESVFNGALGTVMPDTYARISDYYLKYNRTENGLPAQGGTFGSALLGQSLEPKAIQELFELNWGRMNATLGVELPFTNISTQTTIPLGYVDPITEVLTDGSTQLWKITHNGVDTHPVHFHLFDVQVVNRVGWDGAIRPPDANEVGWKDTVRMNPLEDIVVAFRPLSPVLPFAITNSTRVLDPTQATGVSFPVTNPVDGTALTVVNNPTSFGWEYVWHCHILGHEENDFMRAVELNVATTRPAAPTGLTAVASAATRVDLSWVDHATNETGFRIDRRTGTGAYTTIGTSVPDQAKFTDYTVASGLSYTYRVYAYNQAGASTTFTSASVTATPAANPTGVTLVASPLTSAPFGTIVDFTATATGSTGYQYQFLVNSAVVQDYSGSNIYVLPATQPVGAYTVQVNVRTSLGSTVVSASTPYAITPLAATGVQLLPNLPSPQLAGRGITFTATGTGSTAYQYQFSVDGAVVQAYSAAATYKLDPFIAGGVHLVQADVRTNLASLVPDSSATLSYTITAGTDATGVTITPNLASPQVFGTPVIFTAAGSGATGGAYEYAFYLTGDGGATWTNVQTYSTNPSWTMPATQAPNASYGIVVQARAGSGAVRPYVSGIVYYAINSASPTGATLTPTLLSPQLQGTAVTFNAAGLGASNYQYAFYISSNGGVSWTAVQGFSPTSSWTMPGSQPTGNYTVVVQVRSGTNPGYVSSLANFIIN
jgi:FtsP/CotA-like multicopper oxidase with cupredoxin domain